MQYQVHNQQQLTFPPDAHQVDLAREAANLQQFNYNFRNTLAVDFPVPLYPLVSSEVSCLGVVWGQASCV